MAVIPFNVPGLPEPETIAGGFVVRPIAVDASKPQAEPTVALHSTAATTGSTLTDGTLCIYPRIDMISYLYTIDVRSGAKDLLPGVLIQSASVGGSCTLFSLSYDLNNNPVLVINIVPEQYLAKLLIQRDGKTIADPASIDDRLEITQVFTTNSLGALRRISNELTHSPKESGSAIFDLQDDTDTISDVCSFYLSRMLVLTDDTTPITPAALATPTIDPATWRLLWRPASAWGIVGFATVYILSQTSISYRGLNGNLAVDYNLPANRPPLLPPRNNEQN